MRSAGDGAPTALPATPLEAPSSERTKNNKRERSEITRQAAFFDIFAGLGQLTRAVREQGIDMAFSDELVLGGTDFTDDDAVDKLKSKLLGYSEGVEHLVVHVCATLQLVFESQGQGKADEAPLATSSGRPDDEKVGM